MVYTLLPNASQSLGNSRPLIRQNFVLIQQAFDRNHYDFDDAANQGKHQFVQMPILGAAPTTLATEGAIYTKTINALSQLFYIRDATALSEVQLTGPTPINASNGSTFLPGGLLLQWGRVSAINNTAVVFPIAFSAAAFTVMATTNEAGNANAVIFGQIKADNITATGFDFQILRASQSTEGAAQNVGWMAIGPRT
jgi:hypothetical protein